VSEDVRITRALLSVTDKTGIVEFARGLAGMGVELVSTGGTYLVLKDAGLPVFSVSEVTGFPEIMDGRVKTLHPKIEGGILAVRGKPGHEAAMVEHEIEGIELVVVNLYDFAGVSAKPNVSFEEVIENIDIGGPTMIRAAVKNFQHVAVVTWPGRYSSTLGEMRSNGGRLSIETRWILAKEAIRLTATYDLAISEHLAPLDHKGLLLPESLSAAS